MTTRPHSIAPAIDVAGSIRDHRLPRDREARARALAEHRPLVGRSPQKLAKIKLRLHRTTGVTVEPLRRTMIANGLASLQEAAVLVDSWVDDGDLRPRADGGYDVIRERPRLGRP